jgi:hypothetical protein
MFHNGSCPICGRPAAHSCTNCGLKAIPFLRAVHDGAGTLALAYVALQRPQDPGAEREVAWLRYVVATRDWLRAQIGALAEHLRRQRGAHPVSSPLEHDVAQFGLQDAFLRLELGTITADDIAGAVSRFKAISSSARWNPPDAPTAPDLSPTEDERLLAVLKRQGIKTVADLERVSTAERAAPTPASALAAPSTPAPAPDAPATSPKPRAARGPRTKAARAAKSGAAPNATSAGTPEVT